MAAIVAGDLTITVNNRDRVRVNQKSMVMAHVAFTAGAQTYPTNGIPLPAVGAFGMKRAIDFVNVMPTPGDGYLVKYDKANHTLRIYQGSAISTHTHNLKFIGGIAETEAVMIAAGDTLGKNAATDRTVLGADSAAKGGVVASGAVSAGGFTELGTVAVPTLSVDLQVWGE